MNKPNIAADAPVAVDLEEGKTYHFCTCGRSDTQPFCDGTHKDRGEFKSHAFTAEKTGTAFLCMCKHTENKPFCDGTHSKVCGS